MSINRGFTREQVLSVWKKTGRNVSATARELKAARSTINFHLRAAVEEGSLDTREPAVVNTLGGEEFEDARTAQITAYRRKRRYGDWRKPVLVEVTDGPFVLILLGDPHLDNAGTDLELWEKYWNAINLKDGVYGACIGDWLDNFTLKQALAHLAGESGVSAPQGWALLEGYLANHKGLIASCSGNHDDWAKYADLLGYIMRRYNIRHRTGAIRLALKSGERYITVAMRHKWRGRSQFSAGHGMVRGFIFNDWKDHVAVGGHIHQDDDRICISPSTGFIQHCFQISAFKVYDTYANVEGFAGPRTSPARALVIDPRLPDNDANLVQAFTCPDRALDYRDTLR